MSEVTLEFIADQLKRIQSELHDLRNDVNDLRDGVTVLSELTLKLARDMVRTKELLGRIDARIMQ